MKAEFSIFLFVWIVSLTGGEALREGPRLLQEPPAILTFPNSRGATLTCVASATPAATVTWVTADGARADNLGSLRTVISIHGNSTLTLLPFRPDQYRHDLHAATYRCLASNNVGSVTSRAVSVNAVVMQRFEVGVSDATGVVGGPAVFTCDVPPTVSRHVSVTSWTVDGRTIAPSPQPDGRYWVLPTGELVIQGVAPTDAYTRVSCTATHAFDPTPRTSNIARVMVTGEPRSSRPQLMLRRDLVRPWARDDLILPCLARGHPTPSVTWYRDDENRGRVSVGGSGRVQVMDGQLMLSSLRQQDSGHYLCIANNSAGTDSYKVDVQVRDRLSVSVDPSLQRIDLGRPARLACRVSGSPVNSVTWYKDGRPIPPLPRITSYDRTLHIGQVSREDGGMYQCLARNDEDSAQGVAQLDLGDSAPVLEYRFISQTLQPGPSVSLKCIASGAPTPHVSWTLDSFPLPQHERLVVGQYVGMGGSVVSHVNLTGVRAEDGGAYTCTASNRAGSSSHTARLNVYGPAYVRPMSIVTAVAGEQLIISCPAAGYPLDKIIWSRDGRNLPVTARQNVFENGTLVVRLVQKTADSGEYTCTAQDKQGRTHSSTATVQVLVPPTIIPFSFGEASEGERVQAICSVRRGDPPLTLTWLRDGHPLSQDPPAGVIVRPFDQLSSTLLLTKAQAHHSGNYTCQATNAARAASHSATLVIKVPPSWLEAPRDSSVILGGSVHIPCHAQGFPTPKINWRRTREDQPGHYTPILSGGVGLGVGVASNGSLVVMAARAEDEGQYLCEASNGVGGGLSALVKLTVNAPPRFSPGLQHTVSVRRGSRASLICQVLGDPPITLLWQATHANTHDNSMVREVDGGVRGELVIPSVKMEDAGEYTCSASNTYGRDSYAVSLVVQDVPGAPHGLRVSERGSRFLSVSWLPPSTAHTAIEKYIVQYTPASGSWGDGQEEVVDGDTHTTRLSPLLPDTEYLVRLLAANHLGSSPHSEPLQVRTEGEAPSAPPTGVRADAVSANSIRVMWEPPPPHTLHGDLLGYNLGIRRQDVGGDGSYNFTVVGVGVGNSKGREVVKGLSAWAQYAVVMRAYNTHGHGPPSSPVVVRTMEDVPSAPPVGVECSGGARGSSLVVRWAPPPPSTHNGILQNYRLTLTRLDESTDEVEELRKMTNGREETVVQLRPWTNYTVSVAAATRAGAGVASHDLTCTTKEDVAGIPRGLRALQSDVNSALLTWLAPKPPTGVLLTYTLHHRPPHARTSTEHPLHAYANSHTITHLSRGTHEFWMTARTRVGEGDSSQKVKLTMMDQIPAGVGSVGDLVVTTQGEDVRLQCVTVGSPKPRLMWTHHGRPIHQNARFNLEDDGSLVIRGVERGDRGNYTCTIDTVRKHTYVPTSAKYSLHVQVPPSAPSVHIADATSSTLTVSWVAGDTGGAAVRAWSVWWRAAAGGGSWHTRELGRIYTSHVISNLQCGAEYQVYVTARTHVGLSSPSRPLIVRTSGSPPVAPPTRHVASGNTTGVWVWLGRWRDGGCPVTHFTLQMKSPSTTWTTLASSLAPQDVYEVSGLRTGMNVGLRLTAHNAAGATTTTVTVHTGPGGGLGAQPAGVLEEAPPNHLHTDPRLLASAGASALALALTVAAAVLCLRRRAAAGRRSRTSQEDQEAEENKANLLHQRDSYYATVRKPQPVPATLERIPEYSEDIYPYATFQLGEGRGGQDDTATAKFQTFVFQDSRYGVTESHPPSSPTRPTAIKAHGRSRSHGRGVGGPRSESEEYDSLQSDTDTEHATSSRTESSIHLDSATLENHASLHLPLDPHLATLEGGRVDPHLATLEGRADPLSSRRSSNRNVHHNLIYHAPESSTSTEPSPICERKSFPRKTDISKMGRIGAFSNRGLSKMAANIRGGGGGGGALGGGGGVVVGGGGVGAGGGGGSQETSLTVSKKTTPGSESKSSDESKYGFTRRITPPVGFSSSHNELSEAECDLEIRKRNKEGGDASGTYVGHSRFRSYSADKDNKDYSIKV